MNNNEWSIGRLLFIAVAIFTAIIGYHIHGSVFWTIMDWIFWPFAWLKWLLCQEVSMSVIKDSFAFFMK